jgi:hypothetical protein
MWYIAHHCSECGTVDPLQDQDGSTYCCGVRVCKADTQEEFQIGTKWYHDHVIETGWITTCCANRMYDIENEMYRLQFAGAS